jgi:hypothetical protein
MVERLPINVEWFDGETAHSVAYRLGHANFVFDMNSFGLDTGLDFAALAAGDGNAVDRVAELVGIEPAVLRSNTLVRSDLGGYVVNGQRIDASLPRRSYGRCCPQCLVEGVPFVRFWWLIEPCRTCIEHSVPHVQLAQRGSIRHRDPDQLVHEYGDRIRELAKMLERSPAHAGEHYLQNRLRGMPSEPNWLDGVEFSAAAKTMDVFGAVAAFGKDVRIGKLDQAELTKAASAGYDILRGGKASIEQFLADLLHDPDLNPNAGLQEILGAIWKWLSYARSTGLGPVKDVVREFCLENITVEANTMLLGQQVGRQKIHSIITAMKAYNLDRRTTRKVLTSAGLVEEDDARVERLITFDAKAADKVLRKYVDSIARHEIDSYLNMPTRHRIALIAAGHFKPCYWSPGMHQYYHRAQLDEFLRKLSAEATMARTGDGRKHVSIAQIAQYDLRCTAPRMVDIILSGKLQWIGRAPDVRGYAGIIVDYEEVRGLLDVNSRARIAKSTWIKEFGSNERLVNVAIKAMGIKLIHEVSPISNQMVQYVATAEIERIRREFISLRDVAREGRQHWRSAMIRLDKLGIRPIPADSPKLLIYRRSDLV